MPTIRSTLAALAASLWRRLPAPARWWVLHRSQRRFLVGVVGIIADPSGRVLILDHRFRVPWRWGLPGGFVSGGESLETALARELREELELEVRVDPPPFDVHFEPESAHLTITFVVPLARELSRPVLDDTEILGGGWYGPEDLPAALYPRHERLVRRYWAELGAPVR